MRRGIAIALVTLTAIFTLGHRAYAAGAIAEGIAPEGVAKGYGISIRVGKPTADAARAEALAGCKKGPKLTEAGHVPDSGQARARARCEIVATFSNKCAATAFDPKDGTPGAGWAVGDTAQQARDEALTRCRSTAGARRDFCKASEPLCDGSAK